MWDAAAANVKFDAACHCALVKNYSQMLCRICGFPSCGCKGCAERQKIKEAIEECVEKVMKAHQESAEE